MARRSHYYEVLEAGPDWITCTATTARKRRRLWTVGDRAIQAEAGEGNVVRKCPVPTYEGWACGGIVVGTRPDSTLVSATGSTARDWWRAIWEAATNTTRLDLAVTVGGVPDHRHLAREAWTELERAGGGGERPAHRRIIDSRPAGQTLYVGAPTSDLQIRIYDKYAEGGGRYPLGAWRYEVQARAGVARALVAGLADSDDAALASVGTVHLHCAARGVRPAFRDSGGGVLGHVPRSRSDRERRLKWLQTQVLPSIQWLVEAGAERELWMRTGLLLSGSPPSDSHLVASLAERMGR